MGFYSSLEDKYYGFIDSLDKSGIHLYGLVDGMEKAGIPSFPVFIILILLIVGLIGYFSIGMLTPQQYTLTVVVNDAMGASVEGAKVELAYDVTDIFGIKKTETPSLTTSSAGKAEFKLPANISVSAKATKTNYEEGSESGITLNANITKTITITPSTLHKTIMLKDSAGASFSGDVTVKLYCTGNTAFEQEKTPAAGKIEIDIPYDCGSLFAEVLSAGFENDGSGMIGSDNVLRLKEKETLKGTIIVQVKDTEEKYLAGINVKIYNMDGGGLPQNQNNTGVGGTVLFENVPVGNYYVTAHDPNYNDYDSRTTGVAGIKTVTASSQVTFPITLEKAVAAVLEITVIDVDSKNPVFNAPVKLKKNNLEVEKKFTDRDGKVSFNLPENVAYDIEVEHPDYILENIKGVTQADSPKTIYLQKANSENSQAVNVTVVDSKGKPVEGAKISLKKLDDTVIGDIITTGFDGTANFINIALGVYYLSAVKSGFQEAKSNNFTIETRKVVSVTLTLSIGYGTLDITLLDKEGQLVQGAEIIMVDWVGGEELETGTSSEDGKKSFDVRMDRMVFFVADADGYLPYHSISIRPLAANTTYPVEFMMEKSVSAVEVEFLGLYSVDFTGINPTAEPVSGSLTAGQKYRALLRLKLPTGATYSEAGIHLRIGNATDGKTNTMEEDSLYINGLSFGATRTQLKGTSYTPPNGYGTDSSHLTTGDSKWANVIWRNAEPGIYEVAAEITVKDSAKTGNDLKVWYRGWGKSSSYKRDPKDAELGESEISSGKQALYANAKLAQYSVGPSNLCAGSFCRSFSIEDMERNVKTAVIDTYNANGDAYYKLEFLISGQSDTTYADSTIEISSDGDGLLFENYSITDAEGQIKNAQEKKYLISEKIGDIQKGSVISGNAVFKTEKEGSNKLNVVIKSGNEEVFSNVIIVEVRPANKMKIEFLPAMVVPYIDNMLLIRILQDEIADETTEANPLSAVFVTIVLNDNVITSGTTNNEGEFPYMLQSPSPGTLRIIAEKRGYGKVETEIKISESILLVTPSEIRKRINAATESETQVSLLVENSTPIPLTVKELSFSSDFQNMVAFDLAEDYIDIDIAPRNENAAASNETANEDGEEISTAADGSLQVDLSIKLTEKGKLVEKPTTLRGIFTIYVYNKDTDKTWFTNIPVEIRIGLGNELDDSKCLEISPLKWDIITENEVKTLSLEVKNKCTANGEAVILRNIEIASKLDNQNSVGLFAAESTDLEGAAGIDLSTEFKSFAPIMKKNFQGNIELTFTPEEEVESAAEDIEIIIRATNLTPNGEEKIEAKLPISVSLSNLAECIKILGSKEIVLTSAAMNTGYQQYSGYGYDAANGGIPSSYGYGTSGSYGGGSTTGSQYGAQGYSTPYPQSQYDQGLYNYGSNPSLGYAGQFANSSYLNSNAQNSFSMNQTMAPNSFTASGFRIANQCTTPVEINLETVPAISVDESKFTLAPDEEKDVTVNSSQRMGIYPLKVKARIEKSEDRFKLIDELKVIVTYFEDLVSGDCIKIVPPNKIRLTDVIGRPASLVVHNYCYDLGVRLEQDLGISCNVQNISSGAQGTDGGVQNPVQTQGSYGTQNQVTVGADCPLIEQPSYFAGEQIGTGPNGREQVLTFEIKPNLLFRQQALFTLGQNQNATLGDLRIQAQQAYYYVQTRANVLVNFRQQYAAAQSNFPVIIEDWWRIEELAGQQHGNPNVTNFNDCINKDALDLVAYYLDHPEGHSHNGSLPEFEILDNQLDFTSSADKMGEVMIIGKDFCGTDDYLSNITESTKTFSIPGKNGSNVSVRIRFYIADGENSENAGYTARGHNIRMVIYVPFNEIQLLREHGISGSITAKLTRAAPGQTKDVEIPFNLMVYNCGAQVVQPPTTPGTGPVGEIKSCEAGFTGTGVRDKYGYDRLLFEWRWENVKKNNCDDIDVSNTSDATDIVGDTNKFCDASQFSIGLVKKGAAIKTFIDTYKTSFNDDDLFSGIAGFETLDNFRNTENLYRWVKSQIKVRDDSTNTQHLFFLNKDGGILDRNRLDISQFNNATLISGQNDMSFVVGYMETLLDNVKTADATVNEQDIIGVISDTTIAQTEMDKIGVEKPAGFANYVITFNEYRDLHNKLVAAGCMTAGTTTCDIDKPYEGATMGPFEVTTITADLLKKIYNSIHFYVGVRDTANLKLPENESTIRWIWENGKDKFGTQGDIYKFWKENVRFDSFLVKDDYADTSTLYTKAKFKNTYGTSFGAIGEIDFVNWDLATNSAISGNAGKHKLLLNYGWNSSFNINKVELKKVGDVVSLTQLNSGGRTYENNVFFYKGFNAGLGGENQNVIIAQYETGALNAKMPTAVGTLVFENTFDTVKDGVVLDITNSGSNITYSPTSPSNVLMMISSEPSGVFYAMDPIGSGDYLLQWKNGSIMKDHKETGTNIGRICSSVTNDNYGITGSISGNRQSVVYAPANVSTKLTMLCSGAEHTVKSTEFDPDATDSITPNSSNTNVSTNFTGEHVLTLNTTGMNGVYSIEKYLKLIDESKVCADNVSESTIKLYWNSTEFYGMAN